MAHEAKASIKIGDLNNAAITVQAYGDNGKLGTLTVGRGGIYWKGRSKKLSRRMSWAQVAREMKADE